MTRGRLRVIAPLVAAAIGVGAALHLAASAAPARCTLEVFGVGAGDALEIDGKSVPVKTAVAHAFSGQPLPGDAPAIAEIAPGAHEVTLHRDGCAPRTFAVDAQGAYQRTIVVAPAVSAHCVVPSMPPRVE